MTMRNTRSRTDAAGRLERMTLSPAVVLAFVGLTFAGCVASPGSTDASPGLPTSSLVGSATPTRESRSPEPSASASTSLETKVDGYSLSMTVDHPTLAPGATATVNVPSGFAEPEYRASVSCVLGELGFSVFRRDCPDYLEPAQNEHALTGVGD
jgi:hypothetical protein